MPSPPEDEVGDWCAPERVDDHHHRGPYPLRAPDLAGWPALDVDERRRFEDAFGNSCRHDQSTAARAEIAPLSSGHDTLRVRVWALAFAGTPNVPHSTSVRQQPSLPGHSPDGRNPPPGAFVYWRRRAAMRGCLCLLEAVRVALNSSICALIPPCRSVGAHQRAQISRFGAKELGRARPQVVLITCLPRGLWVSPRR